MKTDINLFPRPTFTPWRPSRGGVIWGSGWLLTAGLGMGGLQWVFDAQQQRLEAWQAALSALEPTLQRAEPVQQRLQAWQTRQALIEKLQQHRHRALALWHGLAQPLPDGLHWSAFKSEGSFVMLTGVAQSQQRVSWWLQQTEQSQDWPWHRVQLQEIVARPGTAGTAPSFAFVVKAEWHPEANP